MSRILLQRESLARVRVWVPPCATPNRRRYLVLWRFAPHDDSSPPAPVREEQTPIRRGELAFLRRGDPLRRATDAHRGILGTSRSKARLRPPVAQLRG